MAITKHLRHGTLYETLLEMFLLATLSKLRNHSLAIQYYSQYISLNSPQLHNIRQHMITSVFPVLQ